MRRLGCLAVFTLVGMASSAVLAAPPTLDHPGKKFRFISLAEARAIALERSELGQRWLPHNAPDAMIPSNQAEAIRVLAGSKPASKSIVITGIRHDHRRAEHERNINQVLLNVENAYWNLYGSYWQLHSREQGLRFAHETWKIVQEKYKDGKIGCAAVAQAEGQYNLFRTQRLAALDTVLDNERQLRAMLGLPIQDGTRLVPSDAPSNALTLFEQKPDWEEGWRTAMKKRPELHLARDDVKRAKLKVLILGNVWLPVMRFFGVEDFGSNETVNAFYQLPAHPLWQTPLFVPDGDDVTQTSFRRNEPPCLKEAKLQLARASLLLQDQESKTERFLALYYRRMSSAYFQIKAARDQCGSFAVQLRVLQLMYSADSNEPGSELYTPETLNELLESQRFWAEALATEYQAIVTYNNSVAGWEYAKGDIMKHAHVRFAEKLPKGKKTVRAVEREHKRTRQHVRRELSVMANSPLTVPHACVGGEDAKAPTLVALWKCFPLLKQTGELHSSDDQGPLVEYRVSEIFPPRRVQGGVSP